MSFEKPDLAWLFLALAVPLVLYLLPLPRRRVITRRCSCGSVS